MEKVLSESKVDLLLVTPSADLLYLVVWWTHRASGRQFLL